MLKRFFKRRGTDPTESGSFTDLAFLLIVYFIVIMGLNVNKGFLMNLADKEKPRIVQSQDLYKASLNARGELLLDGTNLSLSELKEKIADFQKSNPNMTLVLSIDPETPYQDVVDVIYVVRRLKVENFSFKMEPVSP